MGGCAGRGLPEGQTINHLDMGISSIDNERERLQSMSINDQKQYIYD